MYKYLMPGQRTLYSYERRSDAVDFDSRRQEGRKGPRQVFLGGFTGSTGYVFPLAEAADVVADVDDVGSPARIRLQQIRKDG